MKNAVVKTFGILKLSLILLPVLFTSCTKPRTAKIQDEKLAEQIIAKADFNQSGDDKEILNPKYSIKTAEKKSETKLDAAMVSSEKQEVKIIEAKVPEYLQAPVLRTSIIAEANKSFPVIFRLEGRDGNAYVTMYRILEKEAVVSDLEEQLSKLEAGKKLIPSLKIKVSRMGTLKPYKNDLGEKTSNLGLFETPLKSATHVQLDFDSGVESIRLSLDDNKGIREIYKAEDLDQRVLTGKDVNSLLQTDLMIPEKELEQNLVLSLDKPGQNSESSSKLRVFQVKKTADIKDPELLMKLKSNQENREIVYCHEKLREKLNLGADKNNCVLVLHSSFNANYVRAKLGSRDGVESAEVTFESATAGTGTPYLRIAQDSVPQFSSHSSLRKYGPHNTILISDIKGKEFYFKRTFERGSANLFWVLPGISGGTDLVRFELEKDRLIARKTVSISLSRKLKKEDREPILAIPAQYFQTRSHKGELLAEPIQVGVEQADSIVLDWTSNSLKVSNSPLSSNGMDYCLQNMGGQTLIAPDFRLNKGILSFSIEGTYSMNPDCQTRKNLWDYSWHGDDSQQNFTLLERFSFKLNDGSKDNLPNLDIPFFAQNNLGFGVWTYGAQTPDEYGTADTYKNLRAIPIIHDFTNGRVVTFQLGNFADNKELEPIIREQAEVVIQDWNKALRRSFKGTPLERSGDYLALDKTSTSGRLGDLDRNMIWNDFTNITGSGVIGVAQIGFNPRSGYMESANVTMYNSNIDKYIGIMKQKAEIIKKYSKFRDEAIEGVRKAYVKRMEDEKKAGTTTEPGTPAEGNAQSKPIAIDFTKLSNKVTTSYSNRRAGYIEDAVKDKAIETLMQGKDGLLSRIMKRAGEISPSQRSSQMASIIAEEYAKNTTNLSDEMKRAISAEYQIIEAEKRISEFAHEHYGCVNIASPIATANYYDQPRLKVFANVYRNTLSHEIGHALGLTHNFRASADLPNYKFDKETSERNYSSIMDYVSDSNLIYDGPGPYDVSAIRAGYTGYLELHPGMFAKGNVIQKDKTFTGEFTVDNKKITIPLADGKYIHLHDWAKFAIPGKPLWHINASDAGKFPKLRPYEFCTDYEAGWDPLCARHDFGSTAEQVVQYYIDHYEADYPWRHQLGNRIRFGDMFRFLGSIFGQFFEIRMFLDEAIFNMAVMKKAAKRGGEYQIAALRAWKFFVHTATTPDSEFDFEDPRRFMTYYYDEPILSAENREVGIAKKEIVIESKSNRDTLLPGWVDSGDIRGYELNKALALIMLTTQGMPHPRYQRYGLRLSFVDFENALFENINESPILKALHTALMNDPRSFRIEFNSQKGGLNIIELPPIANPEATEMLRFQTIISAIIRLDAGIINDSVNFASKFWIGSQRGEPVSDRPFVTAFDTSLNSKTALKFYSYDSANLGAEMIGKARVLRAYLGDKTVGDEMGRWKTLGAKFKTLFTPNAPEEAVTKATAEIKAILEEMDVELKKVGLSVLPESLMKSGGFDEYIKETVKVTKENLNKAAEYYGAMKQQANIGSDFVRDMKLGAASIRQKPLRGAAAQAAIEVGMLESEASQMFLEIMPPSEVKNLHDRIIRHMEIINKIMIAVDPQHLQSVR